MVWSVASALVVAALLSLAAGWRLHGRRPGLLLADALQGVMGGAVALEAYMLTGPLEDGLLEVALVVLLGAWVWLGATHLVAAVLNRLS